MDLKDFAGTRSWLILPAQLEAMLGQAHAFSPNDVAAWEVGRKTKAQYAVDKGVAVIPIIGPMSKRSSFYSFLFGGRLSMTEIGKMVQSAAKDPDVSAIVLDIDSPGGTVSGTENLGNIIYSARESKPVVSFANGMMASAAYWSGSGAHKVVAESTAQVGSIGVVMVHVDYSESDKRWGVKCTVLTAGKYKAIGNDMEPLSDEARKVIQAELDYLYSLFVDTVARNRGVSNESALAMADGKIFIGQQAVDVGLIDQIGTLDDAINMALEMAGDSQKKTNAQESNKNMDMKELQEKHPELYEQVVAVGKKKVEADAAAAKAENDKLVADAAAAKAENDKLVAENKELGKQVVKFTAKEKRDALANAKSDAEKIFTDKLNASNIPAKLHKKVKRCVAFDDFYSDDNFDSAGYSAKVDEEIKDWEGDVVDDDMQIQGAGDGTRTPTGSDADDKSDEDALVDELYEMSGDRSPS